MALLQRITTPLTALLPDVNNVPQRRQAVGAVVASLVFHLLLLLIFVAASGFIPDMHVDFAKTQPQPQPLELTVDLVQAETTPAELLSAEELKARAEKPVIDSTGLAKSEESPKDAVFESDQNMKAASEKPATGDAPLPSQDGRALPFMNFKDQDVLLGSTKLPPAPESSLPRPEPVPQPRPAQPKSEAEAKVPDKEPVKPAATPAAVATPPPVPEVLKANDEQIAVATKMTESKEGPVTEVAPATPAFRTRPVPVPHDQKPKSEPQEPMELAKLVTPAPKPMPDSRGGFQEQQIKTRVEGSISNRGANAVDAVKTPLGVYMKQVKAAIASRWYFYMKQKRDLYTTGSAHVAFTITKDGKIRDVHLVGNTSNSAFGMMCQQSVSEAEIAPPPEEATPVMQDGKLEHDFTFNYVPIQ